MKSVLKSDSISTMARNTSALMISTQFLSIIDYVSNSCGMYFSMLLLLLLHELRDIGIHTSLMSV